MIVKFNTKQFDTQMLNFLEYSTGFIEGVQKGRNVFLKHLSDGTSEGLKRYIDSNARGNSQALQHVYEWYKTGSPEARLYNIDCKVIGSGISIRSTFRQSNSISKNSTKPFYDKAKIMENGIPISIKPKNNSVLAFEKDGEQIFTKKEIKVPFPGGPEAKGSYQKIFDEFFKLYFSQSFLKASGLFDYLENPIAYKANLKSGVRSGKSKGIQTGYNWIINAKIGVE
jgi:hypothetical protein